MKKMPLLGKTAVLLVLALLLLVPLGMVEGLVYERMSRHHDVETEIANRTAQPQVLIGPIVSLHFTEHWTERVVQQKKEGDKTWNETKDIPRQQNRTKYLFPSDMVVTGDLTVEERQRGIFTTPVYSFNGTLKGSLLMPGLMKLVTKKGGRIELNSAFASVLVSDRKGFLTRPTLLLGDKEYPFEPGTRLSGSHAGIAANVSSVPTLEPQKLDFTLPLQLQGTKRFGLVPLADENQLALHGQWPHPSFDGDFLPVDREVMDASFNATWRVTSMASSAQSQVRNALVSESLNMQRIQCMGVSLSEPVSIYSGTDRALKYGFLFVGLTFACFFLYELLARLRIHPVQYGLVGVAQALFFLLLLSLSEHLGFGLAYLLATLGCVGIIGFYLVSVLGSRSRGLVFGGALAGVYGVLYLLLQSEDYALLGGSLVLFSLLAGAMLITRKMDWYGLETQLSKPQPEMAVSEPM